MGKIKQESKQAKLVLRQDRFTDKAIRQRFQIAEAKIDEVDAKSNRLLGGLEKPVKETVDLYGTWLKNDRTNIAILNERIKEIEHKVKFEELFNPKGKEWNSFKSQFSIYFAKGLAYGFVFLLVWSIWFLLYDMLGAVC